MKRNAQNDGAVIQIYSHNNHDSQRWRLHPHQDGSYQLSSKGTNDKKGASNWAKSTEAGQAVLNYPLTEGNTFQNWHFEPTDEGSVSAVPEDGKVYYIRCLLYTSKSKINSKKSIDKIRNSEYDTRNRTNVCIYVALFEIKSHYLAERIAF